MSNTSMTAELVVRIVDMATAPARAISRTVDSQQIFQLITSEQILEPTYQ